MLTAEVVEWLQGRMPRRDIFVKPGPREEQLPDYLVTVTRLPSATFTLDGIGELLPYRVVCRPAAFDSDSGEEFAADVDRALLQHEIPLIIGTTRVISIDSQGRPYPQDIDAGERIPWVCTYLFDTIPLEGGS